MPASTPETSSSARRTRNDEGATLIVPAAWMRPFIRRLAERWNTPALARGLTVAWGARLRRSLGRASLATHSIRLHPSLHDAPRAVVREILAHELAHLAVAIDRRRAARPHGPEWRTLMDRAGYAPRRRVPFAVPHEFQQPRRAFVHVCPVCHAVRRAKRRVPAWRCTACVENGLDGRLVIEVSENPTEKLVITVCDLEFGVATG